MRAEGVGAMGGGGKIKSEKRTLPPRLDRRVRCAGALLSGATFVKKIKLTNGKYCLVDDCDYHLNEFNWYSKSKSEDYPMRIIKIDGRYLKIYMHHAIVGRPINGKEVDHLNGNTLDNRRENLRIVSHRENMQNRIEKRRNAFVGISRHKNRWQAKIHIKGKRKFLGLFDNRFEAQEEYLKACRAIEK